MSAQTINGKEIAEQIRLSLRKEIVENKLTPSLAVILVGNDPASKLYVSLKEKACKEVGIEFNSYYLDQDTTQEQLHEVINFLNNDASIHAILLQLPLPSHLDENAAIAHIDPNKEVDGFHPVTLQQFKQNKGSLIPGLPKGIYELIKATGESLLNTQTLVVANSEIFAQPIIHMIQHNGGNATYCSPDESILPEKTREADILIVAIGRPHFITKDMVKEGSILIDVGSNMTKDGYTGDIDPEVDEIAGYRSPVPGGVGPMTIAMLLVTTVEIYKQHTKKEA